MKRIFILACLLSSCSTVPPVPEDCSKVPQSVMKNTCVAIKEKQLPFILRAWADGHNLWHPDDTGFVNLNVQFLDGSTKQKEKAWQRFKLVDEYAPGLNINKVDTDGDIRVSFQGSGHWSYLGRVARNIPKNQATMNIQLRGTDFNSEWDRVAIHEFLHAIGFEHEHQHPNNIIPWNRERVYALYAEQQGWDRSEVDYQVLNRGRPKQLRTTGFHDDSIMMYPVDPSLTTNGYSVGWNSKLTACDIMLLQELYPAP